MPVIVRTGLRETGLRGTVLAVAILLALATTLAGCGVGPDRIVVQSIRAPQAQGQDVAPTGGRLSLRPTMVAYRATGDVQAEILATDLTIGDLDPAVGFAGISGQIIRVRMFTVPIAGKTPVSNAAANTVIQHAVINNGVLAVYGGSGLLRPRGRPGDDTLAAVLRGGTVRLTRASTALIDPIGTARVDVTLTAPLDAPLAGIIAARLDQIIEQTRPAALDAESTGG